MNKPSQCKTKLSWHARYTMIPFAILAILVTNGFAAGIAQQRTPRSFGSAGEAVQALVEAILKNDDDAIDSILGTPRDLLTSDDLIQEEIDRGLFIDKY